MQSLYAPRKLPVKQECAMPALHGIPRRGAARYAGCMGRPRKEPALAPGNYFNSGRKNQLTGQIPVE